jgi:glycogen synthase
MRVLMLVWTGVATDTRVLREAGALVEAGHEVHVIGRGVPSDFAPPVGITVASAGVPPLAQGRSRRLTAAERAARWALLPVHVARRLRTWTAQARRLALDWAGETGAPDVVHAHDFTTLELADELAREWSVPFVYDSHEYWRGRPTEGRPAPWRARRERRIEAEVAGRAAAVITVGPGVAAALRRDHPHWPEISVVRNSFPERGPEAPTVTSPPLGAVYAGRLARDRELETIAAASRLTGVPLTLMGPGDESWLAGFEPGGCTVLPAGTLAEVDARLAGAGIALVTHSDAWDNHRLALPNKLFHALSLGVPVVATEVGELADAVRAYDCGVLYPPGDAAALAAAVDEVVRRHEHYLERVRAARSDVSWPRDRSVLLDVYAGVSRRHQDRSPSRPEAGPAPGRSARRHSPSPEE